jgi:hypothetical protein
MQLHTDYAAGTTPPYGETPIMDFIWDSNLQIVRKASWSWDKLPDGYPPTTQVKAYGRTGHFLFYDGSVWSKKRDPPWFCGLSCSHYTLNYL